MDSLNIFFDYIVSKNFKNEINAIREYPGYYHHVDNYKKMWKKTSKKLIPEAKYLLRTKSNNSCGFSIPYDLAGGVEYRLNFDVDKLKKITEDIDLLSEDSMALDKYFKKHGCNKFMNKNLSKYTNDIDKNGVKLNLKSGFFKYILDYNIDEIDKNYAKTRSDVEDPIICLDMLGLLSSNLQIVVADGNHQAYEKIYISKNEYIDIYLLSKNLWINALLTELDTAFIKIFNNINYMHLYMTNHLSLEESNKYMFKL
ncbi:hypothetical protein [Romboutsia lituseburensis]|uniref:Uncharacterized protein n=1 Tax=Romboutsia lituseburensis DSM 797 TaxID=1121325 RepID=A0A1G9RT99_9FIRM|nr:hypothetical protein [Romboutsia lituseburensis]CEH32841.1 Hypothetical protein RLITU_0230 [Romboutsia lituseburensis]SDM26508.1 hypothetical protein SAMN04515677_107138 [Romboutsia lituseburensis DSM 797]